MERASTPSLYRLLSMYWQRQEDYSTASARIEKTAADAPEYATEYAAAFPAQYAACERLSATEKAIAGFIPQNRREAKAKADFLMQLAADNDGRLDVDVTAALLSSLPGLIHWESRI